MASMNVSVPDPMRDWVHQRIQSGHYANVSDYIRDLIRRDQAKVGREQDRMREDIAAGMASLRAGRYSDGETFMAELETGLARE